MLIYLRLLPPRGFASNVAAAGLLIMALGILAEPIAVAQEAQSKPAAKRAGAAKGNRRTAGKSTKESTETAEPSQAQEPEPEPNGISFQREIAPILVANCVGCHSGNQPGLARGKLDLTTFANLMKGTPDDKVIDPGKPDESHLILRIKGEEEPRMPQGGNNNGLAEETIARFEQWVKAGARLDAGLDPKAAIASYAASLDQIRRAQLAQLSPEERDRRAEESGRDRWKQANPALTPEITHGEHFLLFSNLPKERAAGAVKLMESEFGILEKTLGKSAVNWVEKVNIFVFNDRKDFVEFLRTIENREAGAGVASSGDLGVASPYLVALDPLSGRKEEPTSSRTKGRSKKASERLSAGAERSLGGLLTEALGESAGAALGKSPRWLGMGLGTFLASRIDPQGTYYQRLRQIAAEAYREGWPAKGAQVLDEGDQVTAQESRAVAFSMVEMLLLSPELRPLFPNFAKGLGEGKKLDDSLRSVYQASREDFLNQAGAWVARQSGVGP